MTNLGFVMSRCREKSGLTQEQAADLIGISKRQLQRYENEGHTIPEDVVLRATIKYKAPEILTEYINSRPIGEMFGGLVLNNINDNHIAVLTHYKKELREALERVEVLIAISINVQDSNVPEDIKRQIPKIYEQSIADVKTAIVQVEKSVMKLFGIEVAIEGHRRHREKCLAKGYKKIKEKPALVAEGRATYKFA